MVQAPISNPGYIFTAIKINYETKREVFFFFFLTSTANFAVFIEVGIYIICEECFLIFCTSAVFLFYF